ncbi:helix-turn-helix domain-containing protein [Methylopila sp. 73B]|uniref:helix-turn-helix domain-containing protein n=1 Tax=Methylopila sp. 73B TaxID=1120792 RepID=UPI0009DEB59E|nr:helix-turn-helix domain-containing protein [Methylopila sp. 73B]
MSAFFSWQHAILKSSLEATTKHVCLTIGCHMAADGSGCWPSYSTIETESGLSRSTVILHVKKAAEAGYLAVDQRSRENGSASSNLYQPRMPEVVRQTDGGSPATGLGVVRQTDPHNRPSLTDQGTETPSVPQPEKSTKAKTRETTVQRLDQFLGGTEAMPVAWADRTAAKYGFSQPFIADQWQRFCNHHIGKRNRYAEWGRAWDNWCRSSTERRPTANGYRSAAERRTAEILGDVRDMHPEMFEGDHRDPAGGPGGDRERPAGGDGLDQLLPVGSGPAL